MIALTLYPSVISTNSFPTDVVSGASPGGLAGKNLPPSAGGAGLIPGLGRPPGGGYGNPLPCSCLENPMDRGTGGWSGGYSPRGRKESDTTERLNSQRLVLLLGPMHFLWLYSILPHVCTTIRGGRYSFRFLIVANTAHFS